jgi:hypothetical protein
MRSNGALEVLLLIGKCSFFYFAKGQILQIFFETTEMKGTRLYNKLILELEK